MTTGTSSGVLRRITLILDEALEKEVIDESVRLGAHSYICSYCSGKPLHDAFEVVTRSGSLVRVELLAPPPEAETIIEYVQGLQRRHLPLTALMDSVTAFP